MELPVSVACWLCNVAKVTPVTKIPTALKTPTARSSGPWPCTVIAEVLPCFLLADALIMPGQELIVNTSYYIFTTFNFVLKH
jgi:hypothetical protein